MHGMANDQEAAALIANTDQVVGFMLAKFDNTAVQRLLHHRPVRRRHVIARVCDADRGYCGRGRHPQSVGAVRPALDGPLDSCRDRRLHGCGGPNHVVPLPLAWSRLTSFSGAVFAAGFFPAVFGGLYLRWGTGHGAFWSMLSGMAATLAWRFGVRFKRRRAARCAMRSSRPSVCPLAVYFVVSRMTHRYKAPGGSFGASVRRLNERAWGDFAGRTVRRPAATVKYSVGSVSAKW